MTSKRKRECDAERRAKRRRKRSRSEPLLLADGSQQRHAVKRLLSRICSVDNQPEDNDPDSDLIDFVDENEDPILEAVPVDMDPEQLGFLVCAQETLRFLQGRGIPPHHPMFARLRTRLLQGIDEMAMA